MVRYCSVARYCSAAVGLDLGGAGTDQVSESGAQLAAFAQLPADAHSAFMIFLNGHMSFEVAVFANSSALESGHCAFMMSFTAKELCAGRTLDVCCFFHFGVGIADAATNVGISWGCSGGVFGGFEIRTGMQVFVEDEIVEVGSLAKVAGYFRSIQFLGCKNTLEW